MSLGRAPTAFKANVFVSTKREKQCRNCRGRSVIVYDAHSGDELCSVCGLVLEARVMSEEQEWRNFSSSDGGSGGDRSRVGGPNTSWFGESGAGTAIMGGDKKFSRLTQAHELATGPTGQDRQLKSAFNNLRLVCEAFGVRENTVERCREKIKTLEMSGNLRSRTGIVHMLAILFLACRDENQPKSIKELADYDRTLQAKDLARNINKIKKLLPNTSQPTLSASAELMTRFCAKLDLSCYVAQSAAWAAKKADSLLANSPNKPKPNIVAGAVIYLVCQLYNVSADQSMLAEAVKSTWPAIFAIYKELLPSAKSLFPPNFEPVNFGGFNALKQ